MMDEVLKRQMFAAQQPVAQADGSGITSGLADVAESIEGLEADIDSAEDYAGVMNALRGDEATVEERRAELAGLVGKKDANQTPESVLTLIQPTLTIMEMAEQESPEGGINMGMMQAPGQEEAMARMAMGEQPVMRQAGSPPGGETVVPVQGLELVKQLQGLVPQSTSYEDYLKQYQGIMGDSGKAYEINPYIAGLQLAAAIANAPKGQLISSVLKPETIKAVSDPILEMAKAKSQTEQAIKLKAAEAAAKSKSDVATAKSDILTKAIPELMKSDDYQMFSSGNKTYVLNKGTGSYTSIDQDIKFDSVTMQDGRVALINPYDRTDVTYIGDKKGENIYDAKPVTGGALVTNKQTGSVEFKALDGMPVDFSVYGNAERGFFKMDKKGNVTPLDETATGVETGPKPTEIMQEITALNEARTKLKGMIDANVDTNSQDFINTKSTVDMLAAKLTPVKGTEFERIMNERADLIYNQTEGTEAEKAKARDTFLVKAMDNFIEAKSTVKSNYNPNEALDKEFASMFGKQVEGIRTGSENASKLSNLSEIAVAASERFTPGALAETRLNVLKLVDATGGREMLKNLMGDEKYNTFMQGSAVDAGDVLSSVGSQFAVMMAEAFPGNLNQSEVDLIKEAGPGLFKSKEGLLLLDKMFKDAAARTEAEAQYSEDFLVREDTQGLSPEAKYSAFNKGLRDIRANNPVITKELIDRLSNVKTASTDIPQGAIAVVNAQGQPDFVPADEVAAFNAVKSAPDKETFLANWPDLVATHPELEGMSASRAYDLFSNISRRN